jgi:hypothetical protein
MTLPQYLIASVMLFTLAFFIQITGDKRNDWHRQPIGWEGRNSYTPSLRRTRTDTPQSDVPAIDRPHHGQVASGHDQAARQPPSD